MNQDGLHVLLCLAPGDDVGALAAFARENLPPVAARVTLAGPDAAFLEKAAESLGVPVHRHVLADAGASCVAGACDDLTVDLAVLPAPAPRRWFGRRVDWGLLEHLPVPVVWVRGRPRRLRRLLLASGGDEHTLVDAAVAGRFAGPLGASATVLHVLSQMPVAYQGLHGDEQALEEEEAEVNRVLEEARRLLESQGVSTTVEVREGLVVETVLEALVDGDHDLLVLGAHSESGLLDRLLLENLTRDLAGKAPVPVLVARVWPRRPSS